MTLQFPPQGTLCEDCKCCQATVYADNVPVCWECDLGQTCKGKRSTPAPAVMASVEKAAAVVEQVQRQSLKAGKALGRSTRPPLVFKPMRRKKPNMKPPPQPHTPNPETAADLRTAFDRDEPEVTEQTPLQAALHDLGEPMRQVNAALEAECPADPYAIVLADLEATGRDLVRDLEAVEQAMTLLRVIDQRRKAANA